MCSGRVGMGAGSVRSLHRGLNRSKGDASQCPGALSPTQWPHTLPLNAGRACQFTPRDVIPALPSLLSSTLSSGSKHARL